MKKALFTEEALRQEAEMFEALAKEAENKYNDSGATQDWYDYKFFTEKAKTLKDLAQDYYFLTCDRIIG